jgi:hypothetical protein
LETGKRGERGQERETGEKRAEDVKRRSKNATGTDIDPF